MGWAKDKINFTDKMHKNYDIHDSIQFGKLNYEYYLCHVIKVRGTCKGQYCQRSLVKFRYKSLHHFNKLSARIVTLTSIPPLHLRLVVSKISFTGYRYNSDINANISGDICLKKKCRDCSNNRFMIFGPNSKNSHHKGASTSFVFPNSNLFFLSTSLEFPYLSELLDAQIENTKRVFRFPKPTNFFAKHTHDIIYNSKKKANYNE